MNVSYFVSFCILGLLASLHVSGFTFLYFKLGVTFTPWDLFSLIILMFWLFYISKKRLLISRDFIIATLFVLLFTIWIGIEALRSPEPIRGFSMFLIMLRNLTLFITIGTLVEQLGDLKLVNSHLFKLGVGISMISLPLFFLSKNSYNDILMNPDKWRPGLIYLLDQGGILRFVGFAEDPNFYSMYIMLSLFTGISLVNKGSAIKWFGLGLIGLSLLLANSRSFFIIFLFTSILFFIFLFFAILMNKEKFQDQWMYVKTIWLSIGTIVLGGSLWSVMGGNIWEQVMKRLDTIERSERFELWNEILSNGFGNIWIGSGLRGAEILLDGMYSHNSYFDILIETGIVGLVLWSLIFFFITIKGFNKLNRIDYTPWIHVWFLLPLMMLSFSILYNPFFWLVAAITVSNIGEHTIQ